MDNADLGPAMAQSYAEGLGKTAQQDASFVARMLLNVIGATLPSYFSDGDLHRLKAIADK